LLTTSCGVLTCSNTALDIHDIGLPIVSLHWQITIVELVRVASRHAGSSRRRQR
jgi:hypothetical protein